MSKDQNSISEIVSENFKREAPRTLFGMIGYEVDLYVWQFVSRTVVVLGLGLLFGWFL